VFHDLPLLGNVTIFAADAAVVWLAGYADAIAEATGIGREFLGILLLGGITSLPEIAVATTGRGALTSMQGSPVALLQGVLGFIMMVLAAGATVAGDRLASGIGVWCWLMLFVHLGAIWLLARTGEAVAVQTGLGTSFFGAVFLGFSTSLPEVSTVVAAVRLRRYEMAISDIFGTNLFNVLIIFLVDALHPGDSVLVDAGRFSAFGALLALVLTAIFLVGLIERRDRTVLHMGYDSLTAIFVYGAGVTVLYSLR
jgi:cation:H+ antiporter